MQVCVKHFIAAILIGGSNGTSLQDINPLSYKHHKRIIKFPYSASVKYPDFYLIFRQLAGSICTFVT